MRGDVVSSNSPLIVESTPLISNIAVSAPDELLAPPPIERESNMPDWLSPEPVSLSTHDDEEE